MSRIWMCVIILGVIFDLISSACITSALSVGALVSLFLCQLDIIPIYQVIAFVLISSIVLIFLMPKIKKMLTKQGDMVKTIEESLIGYEFVLANELKDTLMVSIGGAYWTVKSGEGNIPADTTVEVISLEGNHLVVKTKQK